MERGQFNAHGLGALAASAAWRVSPAAGWAATDGAAAARAGDARVRFGYAAITWGDDDRRAVDDIEQTLGLSIETAASVEHDAPA